MKAHECFHCKQWVAEGQAHDCWTTTEAALTKDLSENLQDAYERLRETAVELGEQRIYASHSSIMFARKSCYFFVRPKRNFLEVVIFLGRAVKSPHQEGRGVIEDQARARHPDPSSRRSRTADHRLDAGSLRLPASSKAEDGAAKGQGQTQEIENALMN